MNNCHLYSVLLLVVVAICDLVFGEPINKGAKGLLVLTGVLVAGVLAGISIRNSKQRSKK